MKENEYLTWETFLELFLAFDCFILVLYNISVLFGRQVYTSWSTAAILLSCTLLLLSRMGCLIFYALFNDTAIISRLLIVSSMATDLPCFCV